MWNDIRDEYINSTQSYRTLSEKYGVNYSALCKVAAREGWYAAKKEAEVCAPTREERIMNISDCLLDKIEKSIAELDRCIVKNKERTKTVEYDYDTKKPINEVVEEKEDFRIIEGMIDKMGLKQLVSTLKDIKDIQLSISDTEQSSDEESGVILLSDIIEDPYDDED